MSEQEHSMVSHSMRLNFDVLFLVMEYLSPYDVHPMMLTCTTLHKRGIPTLFKKANIRITKKNMESFCFFMMQDLSRCRYITSIQFLFWRLCEPLATQLVTILHHASKLNSIILDPMCFRADSRIAEAVSSLLALESVQINGECLDTDVSEVFATAKGPVNIIEASPVIAEDSAADFLEVFSGVKGTLRRAIIRRAGWDIHADIVYTKLTSLTLWNVEECGILGLITSIPNLRELQVSIRAEQPDDEFGPLDWIQDFDAEREANLVAQINGGTWTHLETVRGDINILYALGIASHLRNLHLRIANPDHFDEESQRLLAIVLSAHPTHLHLTISSLRLERIQAIMLGVAALGVTKITFDVSLPTKGDDACKPKDFMIGLINCVPQLIGIQMLAIELLWFDPRPGQSYAYGFSDEEDSEESLYEMSDEEQDDGDDGEVTPAGANATITDGAQQIAELEEAASESTPSETQPSPEPASGPTPETPAPEGKHPDHIYIDHAPVDILAKGFFNICPNLKYLRFYLHAMSRNESSYNKAQYQRNETEGEEPVDITDENWTALTGMALI